jgi:hypothetical protein
VRLHVIFNDFEGIMPFSYWLTVAAAALLPLAAAAEQTQKQPDPADAQVTVPVTSYLSSFQQYRAATDDSQSPDTVWLQANQNVLANGDQAMSDTESGEMKGMPANQSASATEANMHVGHHAHHEGH